MDRYHQEGKFKHMPRGPIGMYVQPRSAEWSLAIEQCLATLISSFICGSYEDERVLHTLIAKHVPMVNKRPRVIVADFNVPLYDVARYRPENCDHPTVYEMLRCDDAVVANTLFDHRRIESILLLPDRNTGRQMIEYGQAGANCSEAFLLNGDQLIGKPSYRAYGCRLKAPQIFVNNPDQMIQFVLFKIFSISHHFLSRLSPFYLIKSKKERDREAQRHTEQSEDRNRSTQGSSVNYSTL